MNRFVSFVLVAFAAVAALAPRAGANPIVRFSTPLGSFDVELCAETSAVCGGAAPNTVANFLRYVDEGAYPDGTFVHRRGAGGASPPVIQGGGYWADPNAPGVNAVPAFDPIPLELDPALSNVRGTLAMARTANPDSATSQWYVNLVDNVALDTSLGGFAVFGRVVRGLDVVDAIGALPIWNAGTPFGELPLLESYQPGSGSLTPYLVYVDVARVPEPGTIGLVALGLVAIARRR